MTTVNWLELKYGEEEYAALKNALDSGDVSGFSPIVEEFESKCSEITGSTYALACSNGTAALMIAFLALKKYLDKEIKIAVPTWTYIAPVNAADFVGEAILVDSDIHTHNMLSDIPDNVDVVCPVDMAGIPADYNAFKNLNIPIVGDSAESFGAKYDDVPIGKVADITTTSFQSAKIIVTGEGGMIFTDNKDLAEICKNLINQGYGPAGYAEHSHIAKGYNFRMSALQAALGIVQLGKLESNISKRKKVADIYNQINSEKIKAHKIPDNCEVNHYSYLIMLPSKEVRDSLKKDLSNKGITTKLWSTVHSHAPYSNYKGFPNADFIYDHHLRLPIHNEMTTKMAEYVSENIETSLKAL